MFKTEVKSSLLKSWRCVQKKLSHQAVLSLEIRRDRNLCCEKELDPAVGLHKLRAIPVMRMPQSLSICGWKAAVLHPLQRCSLSKSSLVLALQLQCHPTRGIFHLLSSVPLLCICAQAVGSYSWGTGGCFCDIQWITCTRLKQLVPVRNHSGAIHFKLKFHEVTFFVFIHVLIWKASFLESKIL